MSQNPEQLKQEALKELDSLGDTEALEAWRVRYLGRKGELTAILRSLSGLPEDERRAVGASANKVKASLEKSLEEKQVASISGTESIYFYKFNGS